MDRIGRYKIVREMGRGAMGVVYHAIDPNIGRPVAIKTIQLSGARKPEEQERLRERLFREARSAGMLSHPGIVTIYDVAQEGDLAYIAMEYVDGPTLDQLLSEQQLSPEMMFNVLGQTAVALDYAHQKGIVHRDVKPANIMIAADNTVKITDFGIAKITAAEQFTITGSIVGTPHYMSPEQVQGQPVDGRSDQFSLAVIAYEMLTGEKPYTGEHLTTVVYKIVAEEPVPLVRLNPSLSGGIETVVRKAMAKKPDARYNTCQEFAQALEKACLAAKNWKTMARGGSLNEPTVVEPLAPPSTIPPGRPRPDASSTQERAARKKFGFLAFLGAVLMAGALLVLIGSQLGPFLGPKRPQQAAETPPTSQPEPKQQPAPVSTAPATATAESAEAKPSPMPPAEKQEPPPVEPPKEEPAAPPRRFPTTGAVQSVSVITSPEGAIARLDGRADTACTTPCSIDTSPGRHTLSVSLQGYQLETRQVDVTTSAVEIPAIALRAPTGALMVSSEPAGAKISVDGNPIAQVTPAQLSLPPGKHTVTVEKDGRQSTQTVEVGAVIGTVKFILIHQ